MGMPKNGYPFYQGEIPRRTWMMTGGYPHFRKPPYGSNHEIQNVYIGLYLGIIGIIGIHKDDDDDDEDDDEDEDEDEDDDDDDDAGGDDDDDCYHWMVYSMVMMMLTIG